MRRTEQVQGLRLMKFEEVYGRTHRGGLSQAEAAEVLGVSERTFRRWRDRYEAEGADGLYDRRLGRLSARRAPVDEVARVLELFDTRYWDFTAKHFHEKLGRSRLQAQLQLAAAELASPWAQARGAQAWGAPRKRPRRALPGMMLHQDGSSHEWVPGRCLIVTMDDATSDIYSAFFVAEEGTMSSFVRGDPGQGPVLLALRRPRQPLLEHARGRRQGGQGHPDPGRPRPGAARHRVDPGLLARGKGALGALSCSAPCRSACPRNSGSPASPTWSRPTASSRRSSCHNTTPASRPRPRTGAPPSSPSPARSTTSCASTRNAPSQTTTVRYKRLALQIPAGRHRRHYVKARVRVHEYPDGTMAVFHGRDVWRDTTPMANRSTAKPARPRDPLRRDRPVPCGQVDSRSATDHFPTGPETATEAVNSYGT